MYKTDMTPAPNPHDCPLGVGCSIDHERLLPSLLNREKEKSNFPQIKFYLRCSINSSDVFGFNSSVDGTKLSGFRAEFCL